MQFKLFRADGESDEADRDAHLICAQGRDAHVVTFSAGMGEFVTSTLKTSDCDRTPDGKRRQHGLWTDDAACCIIAAVQCCDGTGSLGHIFGRADADDVASAVRQMLATLGDPVRSGNVEAVIFAAGHTGSVTSGGKKVEHAAFRAQVEQKVAALVDKPSAVVRYEYAEGGYHGGCMMLPQKHKIAVLKEVPLMSSATKLPPTVTRHAYKF